MRRIGTRIILERRRGILNLTCLTDATTTLIRAAGREIRCRMEDVRDAVRFTMLIHDQS